MKALQIGRVTIAHPVILAPMAGVTDLPFRVLCAEMGCGMVCTEMVSAKAITFKNKNTLSLLETDERERPVSLQLFGHEPEVMAQAAQMIDDRPFDILDVNMGCPVPKVAGNGEGSALMKEPRLAGDIIRALKKVTDKPVTAKIRKGFDADHVNAVEVALALEEAGADAIAVHGRTREQFYSGRADWDIIRQVKEAVSIPVIGNGDVTSPETALEMFKETGCDGVMIGRGVRGNPWLFSQIRDYMETGTYKGKPSAPEMVEMMLRHTRDQIAKKGLFIGIREMRSHIAWYTAGYAGSARLREAVNRIETYEELEALLFDWLKTEEEIRIYKEEHKRCLQEG